MIIINPKIKKYQTLALTNLYHFFELHLYKLKIHTKYKLLILYIL
jgi:hypothetical protein